MTNPFSLTTAEQAIKTGVQAVSAAMTQMVFDTITRVRERRVYDHIHINAELVNDYFRSGVKPVAVRDRWTQGLPRFPPYFGRWCRDAEGQSAWIVRVMDQLREAGYTVTHSTPLVAILMPMCGADACSPNIHNTVQIAKASGIDHIMPRYGEGKDQLAPYLLTIRWEER